MKNVQVGLAILPYKSYLQSSVELFEKEEVDCLEWPFDIIIDQNALPDWAVGLRNEYSNAGRLLAHGVYYSLFDAKWTSRQESWLNGLRSAVENTKFEHITEHFGMMSSNSAHKGFPLPQPYSPQLLSIGIDRIKRIQDVAQLPTGLENLALAFCKEDVQEQGEFIENLVSAVNGFIILDLHNLYCQSYNFNLPLDELLNLYPLHLVKEIHISGGSWAEEGTGKVRRDTHDDRVPEEVFAFLTLALQKCPHLEHVIFEQLNHALTSEKEQVQFRADFRKIREIVLQQPQKRQRDFGPIQFDLSAPLEIKDLIEEQAQLKSIFLNSSSMGEAKAKLSILNPNLSWSDKMISTGLSLSEKWN